MIPKGIPFMIFLFNTLDSCQCMDLLLYLYLVTDDPGRLAYNIRQFPPLRFCRCKYRAN